MIPQWYKNSWKDDMKDPCSSISKPNHFLPWSSIFHFMLHANYQTNLTPFLSVPISGMWTSITLPGTRYLGGFMPAPTPRYFNIHVSIVQRLKEAYLQECQSWLYFLFVKLFLCSDRISNKHIQTEGRLHPPLVVFLRLQLFSTVVLTGHGSILNWLNKVRGVQKCRILC